jgi:hypothetical protein
LAEIALAFVEVKAGDHPVAIERNVIVQTRRELRVRLNTVKGAVQLRRDHTLMHQIGNIGFDSAWCVEASKAHRIGKIGHADGALSWLDSYCMLH